MADQFPTTTCTAQEYTNGEELQTCQDIDDDTWENTFMSELVNDDAGQCEQYHTKQTWMILMIMITMTYPQVTKHL